MGPKCFAFISVCNMPTCFIWVGSLYFAQGALFVLVMAWSRLTIKFDSMNMALHIHLQEFGWCAYTRIFLAC